MQIRCSYCQTMIPISRDEMLAALQHMELHKQIFYDAHCPKCRRSNRVEKKRIEILMPNWKKVIKEMERDASEDEKANAKSDSSGSADKKNPKPAPKKNTITRQSSSKGEKAVRTAEKKGSKKTTTRKGSSSSPNKAKVQ